MRIALLARAVYRALRELCDNENRRQTFFSAQQVATQAGVSVTQVYQGIAYLRDEYPHIPIISLLGPDGGYQITNNPAWLAYYQRDHLHHIETRIDRLGRNLREYLLRTSNTQEARRLHARLEALVAEIGELIPAAPVLNGET